jgi:hypothetical protein
LRVFYLVCEAICTTAIPGLFFVGYGVVEFGREVSCPTHLKQKDWSQTDDHVTGFEVFTAIKIWVLQVMAPCRLLLK